MRAFGVLLALNLLAAAAAVALRFMPPTSQPKPLEAKRLRVESGYPLLPCPDMQGEPCVAHWRASAGVKTSLDKTPTFTSTYCLKVETPRASEATLSSDSLPMGGLVEYDAKVRKVGPLQAEFGALLGPRGGQRTWRRFAKIDWKPSFFPEWTIMHGTVHLPNENIPAEFQFRLKGPGTMWISDAWARRRD